MVIRARHNTYAGCPGRRARPTDALLCQTISGDNMLKPALDHTVYDRTAGKFRCTFL